MDFIRKQLPANVEKYLEDIDFPIGKQELVSKLKQNGAPGVVVDQVENVCRRVSTRALKTLSPN